MNIGNAPLSWGVFEGDDDKNPPWPTVLDEIARAGYKRTELGPVGFLPEDPSVLREELGSRGLRLTAGFVYEDLHDPTQHGHVIRTSRRVCEILSAAGAERLVVIDRMLNARQATAGRTELAARLDSDNWTAMMRVIADVARIAADDYGLRPVLHPHCGAYIEFDDEVQRAMHDLPDELIGLCVDTGHAVVADMQAADLVAEYGSRVEYFHFKDVDNSARDYMIQHDLTFDEALAYGLFCPIGSGMVDFPALKAALERVGFVGSATVEQDPDPRVVEYSGLEAAQQSLHYLQSIGLAG